MKIEIIRSNRLTLMYSVRFKDALMPTKLVLYQCVESDNIVYRKKFLSHSIDFRVNKNKEFKNRIRWK